VGCKWCLVVQGEGIEHAWSIMEEEEEGAPRFSSSSPPFFLAPSLTYFVSSQVTPPPPPLRFLFPTLIRMLSPPACSGTDFPEVQEEWGLNEVQKGIDKML
jgi:hypothetical protein